MWSLRAAVGEVQQPNLVRICAYMIHAECQLYIAEMDSLCTGFEEMQSQNARLLTKLAERDEAHSQLLAERVKVQPGVAYNAQGMWHGAWDSAKGWDLHLAICRMAAVGKHAHCLRQPACAMPSSPAAKVWRT